MTATKLFNINELLEQKKALEAQETEFMATISPMDLLFREEKVIDHTNSKNSRTTIIRPKITLAEYCQRYNGIVDEIQKVKVAIQKYNAEKVLGYIQERDNIRKKIALLTQLKALVPREKRIGRKVSRQGKDGETLETVEASEEPMFSREEIASKFDELAAQERKVNTEIQRQNLNAKVSL